MQQDVVRNVWADKCVQLRCVVTMLISNTQIKPHDGALLCAFSWREPKSFHVMKLGRGVRFFSTTLTRFTYWHPPACRVHLRSGRAFVKVWKWHSCFSVSLSSSENMCRMLLNNSILKEFQRQINVVLCLKMVQPKRILIIPLFAWAISWLFLLIPSCRSRLLSDGPFNGVLLGPTERQALWHVTCQSFP